MLKKIILISVILASLLLVACQAPSGEEYIPSDYTEELSKEQTSSEKSLPTEEQEASLETQQQEKSCTHNENCTWDQKCIAGTCGKISDLYQTDDTCPRCKLTKLTILTSDGETYTLSPGQGSYTAAGALTWTTLSGGEYCQGTDPIIPINILKRNYGDVFSDEVLLLKEGETSKTITHPSISRIAFTLTVKEVEETCS